MRQSDARDSEPLHVSVAGARAGCLLFDYRDSFFVMPTFAVWGHSIRIEELSFFATLF